MLFLNMSGIMHSTMLNSDYESVDVGCLLTSSCNTFLILPELKSKAWHVREFKQRLKQASPVIPVVWSVPPLILLPGYACQPVGSTAIKDLLLGLHSYLSHFVYSSPTWVHVVQCSDLVKIVTYQQGALPMKLSARMESRPPTYFWNVIDLYKNM